MSQRKAVTTGILLLLVGIEAIILVEWASFPYWPAQATLLGDGHDFVYGVLMPLSPLLLVGVLYGRALAYAIGRARRSKWLGPRARYLTEPIASRVRRLRSIDLKESAGSVTLLKYPRLILASAIVLSAVLAYMPYRPDINPLGMLVGVDSPLYEEWLSQMLNKPLPDAVAYAFSEGTFGSRPILLLPAYAIASLTGFQPHQMIQAFPVFLAPVLTASVFIFVRYGTSNEKLASLAAISNAFGFSLTMGMWGGYYANWLALAISYLFLTLMLSFHESTVTWKYWALLGISTALFLTHPWTWAVVSVVSLVFSITVARESKRTGYVWSVASVFGAALAVDIAKSMILGPRTLAQDLATKTPIAGVHELVTFWPNLVNAVMFTHEALLANSIFLGLALISAVVLRSANRFERLLTFWVSTAAVPFSFFGSYHQARIVYDLPIPVLVTMGLVLLAASVGKGGLRTTTIIVLLAILVSAVYATSAMFRL